MRLQGTAYIIMFWQSGNIIHSIWY